MGTETPSDHSATSSIFQSVKLNNPLMGTETPLIHHLPLSHKQLLVKLNNPLMGTETGFLQYTYLYVPSSNSLN